MAVKPQAWAYECDQCGWRKVIAPKGDCIMVSSIETCPKCSSKSIKHVSLSVTELMTEKLVQFMTGRF